MSDLISREAALHAVNAYDYRGFTVEDVKLITDGCADELRKLPSVDAVPVRNGRWDGDHRCTACGKLCVTLISKTGRKTYVETPFCPNCGAKMLWIPTPRKA